MNVTGFECAVIGVSGVFPGAKNVEQWWSQLCEGVIGIRSLSHDELEAEGGANGDVIRGGVVENRYDFDPEFFGYDTQSANIMDPQLRL
ncbi:TPA: beta-ketoacyl synthase N-terminal-like domain-containing protein, partial [Aeromonas salmonicida]